MPMLHGIAKRLLMFVAIIWTAATLNFFLPKLAPTDPIESKLLQDAESGSTTVDIAALTREYRARFELDAPLVVQYGRYLKDVARGDLGFSIAFYPTRVSAILTDALPWTIGLTGMATLIAFLLGSLLGALTIWPGTRGAMRWAVPGLMVFSAIPYYLIGLVLIYFLGFQFGWFPMQGGYDVVAHPGWSWTFATDVAYHATLPALSMVLAGLGNWALSMRSLMVSVQGQDFMMFAEARGLNPKRRFYVYGMRNAILPQVVTLALQFGHIAGGAILVEVVFGYPGIGSTLFRAIEQSDYFVIYGVVLVITVSIAVAMLIVELITPLLDPRARLRSRQ
jgi:peptide/nickel transport system permease protein